MPPSSLTKHNNLYEFSSIVYLVLEYFKGSSSNKTWLAFLINRKYFNHKTIRINNHNYNNASFDVGINYPKIFPSA